MLQALSNGVRFGQLGKESELAPLNAFVDANGARLRRYFDAVMEVPALSVRERLLETYLRTLRAHEAPRARVRAGAYLSAFHQ